MTTVQTDKNSTGRRVAIIGAHATPVGKFPSDSPTAETELEQDILTRVAAEAMSAAGVSPADIDAAVFTQNPPTTR
ncbi:MAG: hypothetical protein PVJ95_10780, partial [Cellvibrionales bacterium]